MLIDGRTVPTGTIIDVDVCIVGGGPAGIGVAVPFLDSPTTKVALIESGGLEFDETTQDLADGDSRGQDYFPMKETRIRAFGGSSWSWGGINAPLDAIDFEERAWVPLSGWPISRTDLDPYYEHAKRVSRVINPEASAAGSEGFFGDEHGPTPSTRWAEIYFTAPTRFSKVYAKTFERSQNVATYLFSTAISIETNDEQSTVEGIRLGTLTGSTYTIRARTYVLAGGGIENARLLLVSGNRERGGLANGNDLVGRYFQEHPRLQDNYLLPEDSTQLASRVSGAAGTLNFSRLGLSDAAQEEDGLLNYIVNLSFGYAGQLTDQFQAVRRIANASRKPWSDSPYFQDVGGGPNSVRWQDIRTALKKPHRSIQSVVGAVLEPQRMRQYIQIESNVEQIADPENRVVLTGEVDAFGNPASTSALAPCRGRGADVSAWPRTHRRGARLLLSRTERRTDGLPDPWPNKVYGCWHHIGTTRMDSDPSRGVVDAVASTASRTSTFPEAPSSRREADAPTLTIVALSLRLAEHLGARLDVPAVLSS